MKNLNLSDDEFAKEVLESDIPVLVDFWAEWCGPCKMLAPTIEELGNELDGKIKVFKMDIEANPSTPSKYGIRSIPTIMLFQNGNQIATKTGAQPKESIKQWINDSIAK